MIICTTCAHPEAEHDEDGICKVKNCPCMALTLSEARHTILARATNAEGSEGLEVAARGGPGRIGEVEQEDIEKLLEVVREQYVEMRGEEPAHVGVAVLPFLGPKDDSYGSEAHVVIDEDGVRHRASDVSPAAAEASERATRAVKNALEGPDPDEDVSVKLAEALVPVSEVLAARARNGEFDGMSGLGGSKGVLIRELHAIGTERRCELHRAAAQQRVRPGGTMTSATVQARVCELDQNGRVGRIINVSRFVPEGQLLRFDPRLTGGAAELWVGPLTHFSMHHDGQFPLESRYTIGRLELEKDKRRRARTRTPTGRKS